MNTFPPPPTHTLMPLRTPLIRYFLNPTELENVPLEMEEKPFNPTSPNEDTLEARLLKTGGMKCGKLRQRQIYWLVCLQHQISPTVSPLGGPFTFTATPPTPIHCNPQTFKVRQTGPFVSSPGGPRTPRGSRLHTLAWFRDFPKILDGCLQFLTPGKACALGESREGMGRGAKRVGHMASVPAAA